MDDTLVDWSGAIERAVEAALLALGLSGEPLASRSLHDEIRGYTWRHRGGAVVGRVHWRLLMEPGEPIARAFPGCRLGVRREAAASFRGAMAPSLFPEVIPALDALAAFPLGVLSNNPMARPVLKKLGILDRFECVVSPDEPFRKPHLDAFRTACSGLGQAPPGVAFAGAGLENDVEAALQAGLHPVIWVDRFADAAMPLPPAALRASALLDVVSAL